MPRSSEKARLEKLLEKAIDLEALTQLFDSSSDDSSDDMYDDDLEDLILLYHAVSSQRYLNPRQNGSRSSARAPPSITSNTNNNNNNNNQQHDIMNLLMDYPDSTFRVFMRMEKESFRRLVRLLEGMNGGGENYWRQNRRGHHPRPVSTQVAVAMFLLGGQSARETRERLNMGHGNVWEYLWRTVKLLASNTSHYIRWPSSEERRKIREEGERGRDFAGCVGVLDGTDIVLKSRPKHSFYSYYSKSGRYGFNLQAVCDSNGRFIYASVGHPAGTDDSTAFRSTTLYTKRNELMNQGEYILADKAYEIDRHMITPYREPTPGTRSAKFNDSHSSKKATIDHAIGVLKARWNSLTSLPIRVGDDVKKDHERACEWVLGCVVLHNILMGFGDVCGWLGDEIGGIEREQREEGADTTVRHDHVGDENEKESIREGEVLRDRIRRQL